MEGTTIGQRVETLSPGWVVHDPWYKLVYEPIRESLVPEFDATRTALLVIDLQYYDAHPAGWLGRIAQERGKPEILQERWECIAEILPSVRCLQDACREGGVEVMHVRVKYLTRDQRDGHRSIARDSVSTRPDERDDDFLEVVAPVGDEMIINKTTSSTFNSTTIHQILHRLGIDRLWISGIVTDGCVEMTARDAADLGYHVTLASDACAASTRAVHKSALRRMSKNGRITVRTVEELRRLMQLLAE